MSEYQYYEFQAVDRRLTDEEMREMRAVSSRAEITRTRFTNEYSWGDFKGRPEKWMERWFDAFLYLANWGSRRLMFRLPASTLGLETAQRYCVAESASAWAHGDFVILSFTSEDDEGGGWVEEEGESLASILPLRAEIAAGDHRALYLGWLLGVQAWEMDDEESDAAPEPPVPPGLGTLSTALQAFCEFLRIDPDLVQAAAERSPAAAEAPEAEEVRGWIASLPDAEHVDLLARVAAGEERQVRSELLRRVNTSRRAPLVADAEPRTVQELREAAERLAEARERAQAEAAAREKARREREAAAARERHLDRLAGRDEELWSQVDVLVGSKTAASYDQAVALLADLRDLAARDGRDADFGTRLLALRAEHARKPSFIERLQKRIR